MLDSLSAQPCFKMMRGGLTCTQIAHLFEGITVRTTETSIELPTLIRGELLGRRLRENVSMMATMWLGGGD